MSIDLSYDNTIGRVQISLTGLAASAVRIERSTNGMLWFTVRGGLEVPVSSGAADLDDFEFFAGQTFYRVLDVADLEGPALESGSIIVNLDRVWLKSIRHPFLNRWVYVFDWSDIGRGFRGSLHETSGRSHPVSTTDIRKSRGFTLTLATRDFVDPVSFDPLIETRDLDLMLAAEEHFFVHVPADSQVPGGYVVVSGATNQRRAVRSGKATEFFDLPCRIEAPPAPGVLPTTLNWNTVRRLYGSWQAVRASNPTWPPLLDTVGDLDDLVVL